MRLRLDGSHSFPKLPSPNDLILLKAVYVLFLLAGIIALTAAPDAVVRTLPYPAAVFGLTALVVGSIVGIVTNSRLRH